MPRTLHIRYILDSCSVSVWSDLHFVPHVSVLYFPITYIHFTRVNDEGLHFYVQTSQTVQKDGQWCRRAA